VDEERSLLCELSFSASNSNSVGKEASRKALFECIDGIIAAFPKGRCHFAPSDVFPERYYDAESAQVVGVAAGISGVHTPEHAAMYSAWIREHKAINDECKVDVFNDTLVALASGTDGQRRGIALIAGTGSNCIAIDGDWSCRVGGWGPLLHDHGSGHALASDVLAACCRSLDGTAPSTRLLPAVERFLSWKENCMITHTPILLPFPLNDVLQHSVNELLSGYTPRKLIGQRWHS
jgi:hypothetical protein